VATINRTTKAVQRQIPDGVSITHTEYIRDIPTTAAFTATVYALNPGNATIFPWLSAIANRYESYSFDRLSFSYKPACPTTTSGTVTMVIDFDALDLPPTTKVQMRSYAGAASSQVYSPFVYRAQLGQLKKAKQYYTSSGVVPPQSDLKTYNVGQIILATDCGPTPSLACSGEISVSYSVRLITPQLNASGAGTSLANTLAVNPYVNNLISAAITPSLNIANITEKVLPFVQANFPNTSSTWSNVSGLTGPQQMLQYALNTNEGLHLFSKVSQFLSGSAGPRVNFQNTGAQPSWYVQPVGVPGTGFSSMNVFSTNSNGTIAEGDTYLQNNGPPAVVQLLPYLYNSTGAPASAATGALNATFEISQFSVLPGSTYIAPLTVPPYADVDGNGVLDDEPQQRYDVAAFSGGGAQSAASIFGAVPVYYGRLPSPVVAAANTVTISGQGDYTLYFYIQGTVLTAPTISANVNNTVALYYSIINAAATIAVCRVDWSAITAVSSSLTLAITATTVTNCECSVHRYLTNDVQL
jgi:hypothetical protein